MRLGGLQKMTLLDFPGRVACTVFTLGCNFRCPFCHNTPLVLTGGRPNSSESRSMTAPTESGRPMTAENGRPNSSESRSMTAPTENSAGGEAPVFPVEEFFAFLKKRQGLLDGVAITGGEPLLHADIGDFIRRIRSLGYAVKLDTNGAFPERLKALIDDGLVDYVAVDIKNSKEKYAMTIGMEQARISPLASLGRNDTDGVLPKVEETVRLLLEGRVDYEFRTTLVDELHEPGDFEKIGRWIEGAQRYFIQSFVDSGDILGGEAVYHAASKEKAEACLAAALPFLPNAALRGAD